jgi:hypothetical protein
VKLWKTEFLIGTIRSNVDAENRIKMFGAKKTTRLGTEKNPEFGSVQSKARFKEVKSTFEEHGWKYRIGLEPDKLED